MRYVGTSKILCFALLLAPVPAWADEAAAAPPPASTSPLAGYLAECFFAQPTSTKRGRKTIADLRAASEACRQARAAIIEKTIKRAVEDSAEPHVGAAPAE